MSPFRIISDVAVTLKNDQLNFKRYLDPVTSVLTDPQSQTPFTIGVFGSWGSGKSSLLTMLDERLKNDYEDQFVRVQFNAWIHRKEPNMLVPLLHTLHDTLESDIRVQVKNSARKIFNVLVNLGADLLLKAVTARAVSLADLERLEKEYLKKRGIVESEIRQLHDTLQSTMDEIAGEQEVKRRTVIFIDDLDRCEPSQIIDLLESIKLFFDLEHVFIILAVDKEVVDRGIEIKYHQFNFKERAAYLGAEYIEKMVQLPLQLFPLHTKQVRGFIKSFGDLGGIADQLDLLEQLVLPNPRKIKRIMNILAVADAMVKSDPALGGIKRDLVSRLIVLQVQSGDLYAEIVKQPDLLLAFEGIPAKKMKLGDLHSFNKFGDRAKEIHEICKQYYRPGNHIAKLFEESSFEEVEDDLPIYLTLLGG